MWLTILLLFGFVGKVRNCAAVYGKHTMSTSIDDIRSAKYVVDELIIHFQKREKRQSLSLFNADMPNVGGCTNCSQMFATKHIVQKQIINQIVHQIVENNQQHDDMLAKNGKKINGYTAQQIQRRQSDVSDRYGRQRIIFRGAKSKNADKTSIHIHGRAQTVSRSKSKKDVSSKSRRLVIRRRQKKKKSVESSQKSSKSRRIRRRNRRKIHETISSERTKISIESESSETEESASSQSSSSSSSESESSSTYEKSNQKSSNRKIFGTKNFPRNGGSVKKINSTRTTKDNEPSPQQTSTKRRKKCPSKSEDGSQSSELAILGCGHCDPTALISSSEVLTIFNNRSSESNVLMTNPRLLKFVDTDTCCSAIRVHCRSNEPLYNIVDTYGNVTTNEYEYPFALICGINDQWFRWGSNTSVWMIMCVKQLLLQV